jgi:hypothetical protein
MTNFGGNDKTEWVYYYAKSKSCQRRPVWETRMRMSRETLRCLRLRSASVFFTESLAEVSGKLA